MPPAAPSQPGRTRCKLRLVAVTAEIGRAAYDVIANGTLWFLHHGLFDHARRPRFDRVWHEAWEGYCQFNEAFADTIAEEAATGATVVVNDYHLALVGRYLAKLRPDLETAFFSHTPFCPPEDLAMMPDGPRLALMESMSRFRCLRVSHGAVARRLLTVCVSCRPRRARDLRGPPRRRSGEARRGGRHRGLPITSRPPRRGA